MQTGKKLREAVDAVSGDALDEAINLVFGPDEDERPDHELSQFIGRSNWGRRVRLGLFGRATRADPPPGRTEGHQAGHGHQTGGRPLRGRASGSDRTVKLWTFESEGLNDTGKLLHCDGVVGYLDFSPDGRQIGVGTYVAQIGALRLWSVETGVHRDIDINDEWVYGVAFSHDGQTLASGGDDGLVILWHVATGTPRQKLENNTQAIVSVVYSPDGRYLATSILAVSSS